MKISDNKITLRPFTLDDVEAHLEGDDAEQTKWMSGKSCTLKSVTDWIKTNQEFWENDGPVYAFAITKKNNGELIGMIDANVNNKSLDGVNPGEANVSYSIYPNFRGQGFAGRAVSLMETFLPTKGIRTSVIRVNPENKPSLRVPEKLGYRNDGQITSRDGESLIIFKKTKLK